MPEGHTLHRLAQTVRDRFGGERVASSSPQGRFAESAALLDGQVLTTAEAWGKHLFVSFDGTDAQAHVHLGLYGKVAFVTTAPDEVPPVIGQIRWRLRAPGCTADLRGPTACELLTPSEVNSIIERLGPDPLRQDADPDRAWRRIHRSRAPVATLLMDQGVLAGVGNVYRAELLFRHGIHPDLAGRDLPRATWASMWDDLVMLMRDGVRTGRIDTVRPEHEPDVMGRPPREDDHGGEVYVYRRDGQPCHVCGSAVLTKVLAARNLFWCPRCQRADRVTG